MGGQASLRLKDGQPLVTDNGQHILDVKGLSITDPLAFESGDNQMAWRGDRGVCTPEGVDVLARHGAGGEDDHLLTIRAVDGGRSTSFACRYKVNAKEAFTGLFFMGQQMVSRQVGSGHMALSEPDAGLLGVGPSFAGGGGVGRAGLLERPLVPLLPAWLRPEVRALAGDDLLGN